MQIFLVRHGEDLPTQPGYLSGEDTVLSAAGLQQAAVSAKKLQHALAMNGDVQTIVSPRRRTIQTAQIIAATLGMEPTAIQRDARLAERDCAAFFGKPASEVFARPEAALVEGGMESYDSLYARLGSLFEEASRSNRSTILVTHSGNVRPLLQLASRSTPDPSVAVAELPVDSYVQLQP